MSTKDSLYKINKIVRNAFERVGIEFQIMPIPRPRAIPPGGVTKSMPMGDSVNWLRIPMYGSINAVLLKSLGLEYFKGKTAVEIGGSEGTIANMLRSMGATVQVAQDYPHVDIENLAYEPESCDIIVLDQILEHLRHPWIAVEQVRRVLKEDGLCICTSVFIYPIHHGGNYGDYYRFSPDGFRAIFEGFNVISADGWGSAQVLRLTYNHSDRGPEGTSPISRTEAERLGIYDHSDTMNYMMTWCVAQRKSAPSSSSRL